jgi:hypothetical protein
MTASVADAASQHPPSQRPTLRTSAGAERAQLAAERARESAAAAALIVRRNAELASAAVAAPDVATAAGGGGDRAAAVSGPTATGQLKRPSPAWTAASTWSSGAPIRLTVAALHQHVQLEDPLSLAGRAAVRGPAGRPPGGMRRRRCRSTARRITAEYKVCAAAEGGKG